MKYFLPDIYERKSKNLNAASKSSNKFDLSEKSLEDLLQEREGLAKKLAGEFQELENKEKELEILANTSSLEQ